jgi:hypothetical protein
LNVELEGFTSEDVIVDVCEEELRIMEGKVNSQDDRMSVIKMT